MVSRPRHGLSLCAGGGGLDLGLMLADPGYHTRAFVEWDEWPRSVLIAAQRKVEDAGRKRRKPKAVPAPAAKPITDLPVFYAKIVNADGYLPVSAISNTMRDAMLARGLVTAERLRERGVR